jgi:hypothetical protein
MSFFYAITNFPFYVLKKFVAGILFFSWWTVLVLDYFGAVSFVFALIRRRYFGDHQKRFIGFGFTALILLITVSSFDGIHLRHLINIQGVLVIMLVLGFIQLKENMHIFKNRYLRIVAMIVLLLPLRFPFLETEIKGNADRIEKNKQVYSIIKDETAPGSVIVSDASDAVWWYCDRPSIWIPVLYSDFKKLLEIQRVDYIYFEKTSDYLGRLDNADLMDFLSTASIIDGSPFGWGLYKINR